MLRLLVVEGIKKVTVTLFDAAEKIIGCPITKFITSKKNVYISPFK